MGFEPTAMILRVKPKPKPVLFPWPMEWLLYLIGTCNIFLVLFDLSYFQARDFYLTNSYVNLTPIVEWYDPYKGAEANYYNQTYADTAQVLIDRYRANPQDPKIPALLIDLQKQSAYLIDNDPYARVDKTGVLERLKNRLRKRMKNESATQSFRGFWSPKHLSEDSILFYEQQIKPLIIVNYFRKYGEDGEFIDKFWRIDTYFVIFAATELFLRTLYISWKSKISVGAALSSRWYDWFWILTFTTHWGWLRLLRFIPYTARSELLGAPFSKVVDIINERLIQYLASRVTDLVIIQIIDEIELAIRRTDFTSMLPTTGQAETRLSYQLNDLVQRQTQSLVNKVLPDVEPEAIRLMQHIITNALQSNPILRQIPATTVEQFIRSFYRNVLQALQASTPDPPRDILAEELTRKLTDRLVGNLRAQQTMTEIQDLLITALEDTKQSYLQRRP